VEGIEPEKQSHRKTERRWRNTHAVAGDASQMSRRYSVSQNPRYTLPARNHIVENHVWRGGTHERTETIGNHAQLGEERTVFHVLPGNRIVRIGEFSQTFEVVDITVSSDKCTVIVGFKLKPGFTQYKFVGWHDADFHYTINRVVT
jgi:hypothetical protein